MMARTTEKDVLKDQRLLLVALYAHRAQGDDIDDVIRRLERVIAKKEKEMAQ
jgi:Flp pilus assembly protein TadB